jgi:RNA polymerase sigma-54 factor
LCRAAALRRLCLRPADVFKPDVVRPVVADLSVFKSSEKWTVEIREEELPKFYMRSDYMSLKFESDAEKECFRMWKTAGKWLVRSLKRRKFLLLEIGAALVRKQAAFLDQKGPLCRLSLQDLAKLVHLHESTLSRAISGKYAWTPRGLLPLHSLISTSPDADRAKYALCRLIEEEDKKKPMNDAAIAFYLEKSGCKVARRTIAKYRRQLNIAHARFRKYRSTYSKSEMVLPDSLSIT